MRTTLDIDQDILAAIKEAAQRQRVSIGQLVSRLLRESITGQRSGLTQTPQMQKSVAGFQPFASEGVLISDAQIDALRDVEGV